jgi:hypothetical protein
MVFNQRVRRLELFGVPQLGPPALGRNSASSIVPRGHPGCSHQRKRANNKQRPAGGAADLPPRTIGRPPRAGKGREAGTSAQSGQYFAVLSAFENGSIRQSVQNGQFLISLAQKASHLLVTSHADKRIERLFVHVIATVPAIDQTPLLQLIKPTYDRSTRHAHKASNFGDGKRLTLYFTHRDT